MVRSMLALRGRSLPLLLDDQFDAGRPDLAVRLADHLHLDRLAGQLDLLAGIGLEQLRLAADVDLTDVLLALDGHLELEVVVPADRADAVGQRRVLQGALERLLLALLVLVPLLVGEELLLRGRGLVLRGGVGGGQGGEQQGREHGWSSWRASPSLYAG